MNTSRLKIFVSRDRIWGDRFALRIGQQANNDQWAIAQPVQFAVPEHECVETVPALSLSRDDAQALMDELFATGIRPSEGSGSTGQLAAVQAHLKDMQKLVFEVAR